MASQDPPALQPSTRIGPVEPGLGTPGRARRRAAEPLLVTPFWWLRYVPAIVLTLLALELVYIVGRVAIIPVLASFAIAFMLNPLVFALERRGLSRGVAALVALVGVALATVVFIAFVVPELWSQGVTAGQQLTQVFTPETANRVRAMLREWSPAVDRSLGQWVEQAVRDPSDWLTGSATWVAGALTGMLSTAAASLDLILVPFFVYYILVDFATWRRSSESLIPPRFRSTFERLFDEVGRILEAYVTGQLLVAGVMAVLYALGFRLLGVPAWAAIAAISGLLNTVPYVGTALGIVLATGFTMADGGSWLRVTGVLGVFVIVQNIEGFFLTPRILGGRLRLHPMAVFLGLLVGGKLFGLLGILLAVPTIAVGKVFAKFLRELYLTSAFYRGETAPAPAATDASLEARMARAAEHVLQNQAEASAGDELLAPGPAEDDPAAASRRGAPGVLNSRTEEDR